MIYDLAQIIREANKEAHIEISKELKKKGNGLFTVVLRVNGGNIVDTVVLEYYTYGQK